MGRSPRKAPVLILCVLFENPIFPFHFSKRFLWSHSNSLSLFSSNSFRDLFSLTSRQCIRSLSITTPLHIVPEWYFLCQYAMLKAVPNKNAGFIILLTSILILFFFGEIRNLTTFTRLIDCNNGFSISFFFLSFLYFL